MCTGDHNTADCKNSENLKCANCGDNHKSNDPECEVYKRATNRKNKNSQTRLQPVYTMEQGVDSRHANSTYRGEMQKYSVAVRGNKVNNNKDREARVGDNSENVNKGSSVSIWEDIKNIWRDIDLKKIMNIVKKTVVKIKECTDGVSKISCLFEAVIEIFG